MRNLTGAEEQIAQLVLREDYQEYLKLLEKQRLKLSSLSQLKLWKVYQILSKKFWKKDMKSAHMDTSTQSSKKSGVQKTTKGYPKHSLRHTNPYLKKLSDTGLQNSITESVENSIRVEIPMFRFSNTCGSKKKSRKKR